MRGGKNDQNKLTKFVTNKYIWYCYRSLTELSIFLSLDK